jgi:outer membrane lipoprotein-sorting protein
MGISLTIVFMLFAIFPAATEGISPATLVLNMEIAYEKVEDYRMEVEVRKRLGEEGSWKEEKFTYTHKKPRQVRIDFRKPHRGTIVVYPGRDGKVLVRPWGRRALDLHLSEESFLLGDPSGQRIDQTDLGLLIQNISASLGEGRRGHFEISEEEHSVVVKVPAKDHFLKGKVTLYEFVIDRKSWLPVEIREFTPEGSAKRRILFSDIKLNLYIPDSVFSLNGK